MIIDKVRTMVTNTCFSQTHHARTTSTNEPEILPTNGFQLWSMEGRMWERFELELQWYACCKNLGIDPRLVKPIFFPSLFKSFTFSIASCILNILSDLYSSSLAGIIFIKRKINFLNMILLALYSIFILF